MACLYTTIIIMLWIKQETNYLVRFCYLYMYTESCLVLAAITMHRHLSHIHSGSSISCILYQFTPAIHKVLGLIGSVYFKETGCCTIFVNCDALTFRKYFSLCETCH